MDDKPLTVVEVAHRWRCSPDTVRTLIASGKLAAFRVGKLVRISPAAVAGYEAQSVSATQAAAQAADAAGDRLREAIQHAHIQALVRRMKR